MIKQILFIIPALLILTSCGEEKKELQQDPNYNYVEIEECTIPIPKRFEPLKLGKNDLYRFSYHPNSIKEYTEHSAIDISKKYEDDYLNDITVLTQDKRVHVVSETENRYFKIINWQMIDRFLKDNSYRLYGEETSISIINAKKEELDYLLNYCEKTWKLNKETTNANKTK